MNKILIIEDDLEINTLLADFLKEKGYAVHCQYDGLHVLDFLNKEKIDLIILDIMLPYRSGDIILSDVRKKFKQTLALDHINLQIKKGKIYGFIGQNGAGKTTFLRLVTGLAFPTSGTLSLWGNSGTEELQKQRKRIGSMIETPALFPSMTAYQNMEVQRIQRGIPDKSVIKRTLDMVGLQDTGKKSVRNFSLGMCQ